jgi:hypothetical protein
VGDLDGRRRALRVRLGAVAHDDLDAGDLSYVTENGIRTTFQYDPFHRLRGADGPVAAMYARDDQGSLFHLEEAQRGHLNALSYCPDLQPIGNTAQRRAGQRGVGRSDGGPEEGDEPGGESLVTWCP